MQWLPSAIAVYGAVVSTAVAFIQIRKYLSERKFLRIKLQRGYGESGETIDFRVANTGNSMTRIEDILFFSFEVSDHGYVERISGNGAKLYDRGMWYDSGKELETPFDLKPGDAFFARFEISDREEILEEMSWYKPKFVNLFSIEIEHSQHDVAAEKFFAISENGPFCKPTGLADVGRLDLLRSRIWDVDKARG